MAHYAAGKLPRPRPRVGEPPSEDDLAIRAHLLARGQLTPAERTSDAAWYRTCLMQRGVLRPRT